MRTGLPCWRSTLAECHVGADWEDSETQQRPPPGEEERTTQFLTEFPVNSTKNEKKK